MVVKKFFEHQTEMFFGFLAFKAWMYITAFLYVLPHSNTKKVTYLWSSSSVTFHTLLGIFAYFIIRFLLNSLSVKFDYEIRLFWNRKKKWLHGNWASVAVNYYLAKYLAPGLLRSGHSLSVWHAEIVRAHSHTRKCSKIH